MLYPTPAVGIVDDLIQTSAPACGCVRALQAKYQHWRLMHRSKTTLRGQTVVWLRDAEQLHEILLPRLCLRMRAMPARLLARCKHLGRSLCKLTVEVSPKKLSPGSPG